MKIVEFSLKHALLGGDHGVTMKGKPIIHPDGRPVMAGELQVGKVYVVAFDESAPTATFQPAIDRKQRRMMRRGRIQ